MTGYTVHTGSNDKFAASWDRIFAAAKPKKSEKSSPQRLSTSKSTKTKKKSKKKS